MHVLWNHAFLQQGDLSVSGVARASTLFIQIAQDVGVVPLNDKRSLTGTS